MEAVGNEQTAGLIRRLAQGSVIYLPGKASGRGDRTLLARSLGEVRVAQETLLPAGTATPSAQALGRLVPPPCLIPGAARSAPSPREPAKC